MLHNTVFSNRLAGSFLACFLDRVRLPGRAPRLAMLSTGVLVAALCGQSALAQGDAPAPKKKGDPYEQICKLVKAQYIAPKKSGGAQALRLTIDVHPDVPKGAKLNLELEYEGLPVPNPYEFLLKDNRRKGVVINWKLKDRLAIDEYRLIARMPMRPQTPTVKKKIRKLTKKFPPKFEPWKYYFFSKPITIGTKAELAFERQQTCDTYNAIVDKLVSSMIELNKQTGEVKDGKKLVSGGVLDQAKFTALVAAWRKKQGEVQKEIRNFPETQAAAFQKTKTAYQYLTQLGQMVSKSSWVRQQEIAKQYNVPLANPPSHPEFNRGYRFLVNRAELNKKLDRITELVCPAPPVAEPPAAAKPASGK